MGKNRQHNDMSVYEASDFWDDHDFDEFDGIKEVKDFAFSPRAKKYIGIDSELYAAIKDRAKKMNNPAEVLIGEWLSEKTAS